MENGIFSAGERAPEVEAWEQRQKAALYQPETQNNLGEEEKLGEVVDESGGGVDIEELGQKVGMGENDLMTESAMVADEEVRKANTLLGSYGGIAVNKLAGRGADPVTDDKVVDELIENMKREEEGFKRTGDVAGFYDGFDKVRQYYQIGAESKADSEVVE